MVDDTSMRQVRSSIFLIGPLVAKMGKATASYPADVISARGPLTSISAGCQALGVVFEEAHGNIMAETGRLQGADIHLDIPSVGATENIMMCAAMADGMTVIRNAAKEPEIVDLQTFLNSMGARIRGAGTDVIRVEGVEALRGCEHAVMPDRIEVGTLMVGAAITTGDVYIKNAVAEHVQAVASKLREVGVTVSVPGKGIRVTGSRRLRPTDIKTLPYPGFPTDMQPQMMALLSIAEGTSVITETIFESRFKQAEELEGCARIRTEGRTAIIKGVPRLSGARGIHPGRGLLVLAGLWQTAKPSFPG